MKRYCIAVILWLTLLLSAHGASVEIPVTPKTLDQDQFRFAISTNAIPEGVSFHVIITAKTGGIPPDAEVGLSIIKHTEHSASIEPLQPTPKITLAKDRDAWRVDFVAAPTLLKRDDVFLVFTVHAHTTSDGKDVSMPASDFYEFKLRDFLPR